MDSVDIELFSTEERSSDEQSVKTYITICMLNENGRIVKSGIFPSSRLDEHKVEKFFCLNNIRFKLFPLNNRTGRFATKSVDLFQLKNGSTYEIRPKTTEVPPNMQSFSRLEKLKAMFIGLDSVIESNMDATSRDFYKVEKTGIEGKPCILGRFRAIAFERYLRHNEHVGVKVCRGVSLTEFYVYIKLKGHVRMTRYHNSRETNFLKDTFQWSCCHSRDRSHDPYSHFQ